MSGVKNFRISKIVLIFGIKMVLVTFMIWWKLVWKILVLYKIKLDVMAFLNLLGFGREKANLNLRKLRIRKRFFAQRRLIWIGIFLGIGAQLFFHKMAKIKRSKFVISTLKYEDSIITYHDEMDTMAVNYFISLFCFARVVKIPQWLKRSFLPWWTRPWIES